MKPRRALRQNLPMKYRKTNKLRRSLGNREAPWAPPLLPPMANLAKVNETIGDLVQRSRLGDQVATATIAVIGTRARKGDKKSKKILDGILAYATKNKPKTKVSPSMFGVDPLPPSETLTPAKIFWKNIHTGDYSGAGLVVLILSMGTCAPSILARGPNLLTQDGQPNPIVESVRSAFAGDGCPEAFDAGNRANDPVIIQSLLAEIDGPAKKALQTGLLIGRARRIQAVSHPQAPISILSTDTGWEFGE